MPDKQLISKDTKYELPSIDFREHTLGNGMKVVMSKFGNIPMVALNTTFHIGSKDEEENKTGLAHLFEHLMFEGSPNVPKGEFDEILTKHGGDSNAYTSRDSTSYFITLPSNKLETAIWLDSDRINGFGISEESLEIQKDVVLEEKLLYVDNSPYGTVEEESSSRLYKKNGYRWPVIGNMDDLKKVTIEEVKDFYQKFYRPDNAVISIVGDIDYDKTLMHLEKYYGNIIPENNFKKNINFEDDDLTDEIRHDVFDNVHLEGQFIFYKLPKLGTKDFYALNLLSGILSDGDSSRFYNELEYNGKLVNEIDSSVLGMENTSLMILTAIALKGKSLIEIENKIEIILEDIRNGNITDKEFEKVKNRIETYFSSKRQSIVSIADKFSYLKTFYNDCNKINTEILDYLSLTKEDLTEAAKKYLNKNQRLVLNYLPKN
ncbi:MAG TPA: pitrilysin family protein [Ignavibacteria bacterium]|nr:pitrilysin family protein [Ignavibacteria bacterium]